HQVGPGARPLVVMEREAVRQGDGFLLEVARCAHGLLLFTAYAQSTSPNTQTARPSGTSRTGAATPSAATTKIIPAAILVTRPIGMSLLRIELSNPPPGYTISRDQRNTHATRIPSSRPRAVKPREARSTPRAEAHPCSSCSSAYSGGWWP